jgi:hypothetical protein
MEKTLKSTLCAAVALIAAIGSTPVLAGDFKSLMEIETEKLQQETEKLTEFRRAMEKINAYANDRSLPFSDRESVVRTTSAKFLKIIEAHCLDKDQANFDECEPLFQRYIDAAAKVPNDSLEREERARQAQLDAEEAAAKQKMIEAQNRRPKKTEVCGPDHWVKDHWEPSCR